MGRPENTELADLRVAQHKGWYDSTWTEYRRATPADLVAAVREAMESGTVEGEVVEWCEVHADRNMPWLEKADQIVCRWAVKVNGEKDCRIVSKLLISVSDGGRET